MRHSEVRDITATLLSEVCTNVEIEPHLQPLTGEHFPLQTANSEQNARLDVAANGVWGGRFERTFFDVRVFNPFAKSNMDTPLATTYRRHENDKRREYEQRVIQVEHSSFVPLVFSATWYVKIHFQLLPSPGSETVHEAGQTLVCDTRSSIRCRLSFALLRAAIMCIRGVRSSRHKPLLNSPFDLQVAESCLSFS